MCVRKEKKVLCNANVAGKFTEGTASWRLNLGHRYRSILKRENCDSPTNLPSVSLPSCFYLRELLFFFSGHLSLMEEFLSVNLT